MLPATYAANISQSPACSIDRLSLAKVENVVKPPHSPVVRSRHHGLAVDDHLENTPYSTPISRHPSTLTMKVCTGKPTRGRDRKDTA